MLLTQYRTTFQFHLYHACHVDGEPTRRSMTEREREREREEERGRGSEKETGDWISIGKINFAKVI